MLTGVPGKPIGPIDISDVERKNLTLRWEPPSHDGGSPLTGYIIEKRETRRPTWTRVERLPPDVTVYKARELTEGKEYDFHIIAENKLGASEPLETDQAVMPKSPFSKFVC